MNPDGHVGTCGHVGHGGLLIMMIGGYGFNGGKLISGIGVIVGMGCG
jgi:hypothetical protein